MQKQNFIASLYNGCKRGLARFTEGVFYKGDRTSKNRERLFVFNLASNLRINLIGGSFLTGLLLLMDADDGFIGLTSMISTAANVLQIIAPSLINRAKNRKRVLLMMRIAFQIVNVIFIGLIPMFPVSSQFKLMLVAVSLLFVHSLSALHAPSISTWHIKFVPGNIRVRYYALFNRINGILVFVGTLVASKVLDIFKANGLEYMGLLTLRAVATIMLIIEIVMLIKLDPPNDEDEHRVSLKEMFTLPIKAKSYLCTAVACTVLWNVVANIPGSYYTVYLLDNVKVSYTFITTVNLLNLPMLMFVTPLWSKYKQKTSWMVLLATSMGIYAVQYLIFPFVTANALWLYVAAMLFACFGAVGINLAFGGIPYMNIPKENQSVYIAFYSTIANIAAFTGVTIGRTLITGTTDTVINFLGIEMISKQYWLFLVGFGMLLAAGALYLIQKKFPQNDG